MPVNVLSVIATSPPSTLIAPPNRLAVLSMNWLRVIVTALSVWIAPPSRDPPEVLLSNCESITVIGAERPSSAPAY